MSRTPHETPFFAVIFSSNRTGEDAEYDAMAERMVELARAQPGFLGVHSARNPDGFGITVSYWEDEQAILAWKRNAEHLIAQELGRREWYDSYEVRVARVERSYRVSNRQA